MELIQFLNNLWRETISPTIKSSWEKSRFNTDRIVRAIQNKEITKEVFIKNPEDVNSSIVEAQKETTEAIKSIPVTEIPETDLSVLEGKLDEVKRCIEQKDMSVNVGKTKVNIDTENVVKAIEKMENALPEIKEPTDYTLMLDEIMKILESPKDYKHLEAINNSLADVVKTKDIAVLAKYLQAIIDKEIFDVRPLLDEKGRVKVNVDKVGGGGGMGLTSSENAKLNTLATETKQDEIIDNQTDGSQKTQIVDSGGDIADVIATNGSKGLVTLSPGHISTENSTSTLLDADTTFTGDWEETTNFGVMIITVKASHASATDGLEVEFSSDGTNIDSSDCFTIPATTGKTFSFQAAARYFRVKYTNGDTNQTYLRLQTILKPYYVKPSSHRINDAIIGQDDAELVKAVLTGLAPDGAFKNVLVTNAGNQKISIEEYDQSITSAPLPVKDFYVGASKGDVTGYSVVHKYGRNSNLPNGAEAAITSDGAITFLSTASTVRIKAGGNANDISTGTGAREITVQGSDENGEFVSETIATNGANASTSTTATFLRIYRVFVSEHGTYLTDGLGTNGSNQADIVIQTTGGTDLIAINQHEGQTQYGAYHIPSNKTGYLMNVAATVSSNKEADILMYARDNATNTTVPVSPKRLKLYLDGVVGETHYKPVSPQRIGSDCDVWFTAKATALGTEASIDFEILLIDN